MNWLIEPLQNIFQWTFNNLLIPVGGAWTIFALVITGGLVYWLTWQKKYNTIADEDSDQIK